VSSALHQDKTAPAEPEGRILPVSCRQEEEAPVIRLGLADDEPLHIMGLATLLGAQPDMEIIWRAADGKEALARNAADPADVLLLDVQMPGLSGPATTRELMARGATGRVVILTTSDTDAPVMDAIEAGASGLLLTSTPPQELAAAIRAVHDANAALCTALVRPLAQVELMLRSRVA